MREIEAFLAVAEERHFGHAAQRLQVSPSAVSQTVRTFERRVGGTVFLRTSRSVVLTQLGEQLLAELRPAYDQIQAAIRTARQGARTRPGPLRVALSTSVPVRLRNALCEQFALDEPSCTLIRYDLPSPDLINAVIQGQVPADVVVTWLPENVTVPEGVTRGPVLLKDERALMMSPRHPLARRESISAEELAEHDVRIPHGVPRSYRDGWLPPLTPGGRPVRRVDGPPTLFLEELPEALAGASMIHLTVASIDVPPGLVMVPLTGLPPMPCVPLWPARDENPWIGPFVASSVLVGSRGAVGA